MTSTESAKITKEVQRMDRQIALMQSRHREALRAEQKAKAKRELAELTELAERVLSYETTFTMVDKVQTPAQRRAHEPIGQSKRWIAHAKIGGLTVEEFTTMFGVWMEVLHYEFEGCYKYTQKEAKATLSDACATEVIRFMSYLRWQQPEKFAEIMAFFNKEEI